MEIAVLVNLRARRGSEAVARACRAALPGAQVRSSRSLLDAEEFARSLAEQPPELVVSAGGDGSAVALLNAMRAGHAAGCLAPEPGRHPALGVLPLGTGNGWANATGAPSRWRAAVNDLGRLSRRDGPPPLTRFELLDVSGIVAPFAGTGWDAELIADFHAQKEGPGILPLRARRGLAGYLHGIATRTLPRHLFRSDPVEVELVNLGEPALTVDEAGRAVPLAGGEPGAVLYRGPTSVCAAGTTPEWGFGFRAFPFAGLVPRRFCMRIYAGRILEATMNARALWRGAHPFPKMHTFLLTRCRATFSRPVPFQIGGDRQGQRTEVEYSLARQPVDLLDWRAV